MEQTTARAGGAEGGTPDELLAACIALRPAGDAAALLGQLDPAGWDALADSAFRHNLAPLLHATLSDLPGLAVPAGVAGRLQAEYRGSGDANARMYQDLAGVSRELDAAGIPLVVLKGAYLARAVYGDPALRPMGDMDLLVPRADLERAGRILLELGYSPENHPELEKAYANNHHLLPFQKEGSREIELHWSIDALGIPRAGAAPVSPFALSMDEVWARVQPAGIPGAGLLALSPEDLVLHLCLHASFHHGFNIKLHHLCDIGWVARRGVDWDRVESTALAWNAARLVYATLRLTREVLDAPIPDGLLRGHGWTAEDERVYPTIRAHVLRRAERYTREFDLGRRVINPWLGMVTGMVSRAEA